MATPDLLAAEPAVLTGQLVGYGRVSTSGQSLDRQLDALHAQHCVRIFTDEASGKDALRPELFAMFGYVRAGDTVVVLSLDRLGRSLADLIDLVGTLRTKGVRFRSLHEAIDTTTPGGRLVFHIFAALAEFIRELIVAGTHEGLAAARARGQKLGRPQALSPDQIRQARALLTRPEESVSSIARLLGVSRSTLYKAAPELKAGGRGALTAAVQAEALAVHTGQAPGQTALPVDGQGQVGRDEVVDLGPVGSYVDAATLTELVTAPLDNPGDYDVDGLAAAVRTALNTELAGTGIVLEQTGRFVSTDPAHEDNDQVADLIAAALDEIQPRHRRAPAATAVMTEVMADPSPVTGPAAPERPTEVVRTVDLAAELGAGWNLTQTEDGRAWGQWQVRHDSAVAGYVTRASGLSGRDRG